MIKAPWGGLKIRNLEKDLGIHNEILLEAPIEVTDEVAPILEETMEETGTTLLKIVSIEAGVVVVWSWAEK